MDPSRRDERADTVVLCAVWVLGATLLGWFAGADVSGLDAGEIGGAAYGLGVAHPTGFPLDMLLLRAAALVPLGPLAFRENVGVALIAASALTAAAALCLRVCTLVGVRSPMSRALAAWVCATSLIASATFLQSALAVEVYSTSLLCLLLSAAAIESGARAGQRAVMPLIGFGVGAHITSPLLMAPLAVRALWGGSRRRFVHALVCAGLGALVLAYLPLASRKLGPFDWGHPATLLGLWRHLSAARIREAFAPELFGLDAAPRRLLLLQLAEAPFVLAAALGGIGLLWWRARPSALTLGWLLSLDLAYATWINPMGIADRQVGHASIALLCVAAGGACAWALERVRAKSALAMQIAGLALAALAMLPVVHADWPQSQADGYAVAERYGALSPLAELPARSVYVCASDSACASALFAVYAEGARPDLAVVPAQHLWDASVLRRLRGLSLANVSPEPAPPEPGARADLAERNRLQLMAASVRRPVFVEELTGPARAVDARFAPCLRGAASGEPPQLDALMRARFGAAGPRTELTRGLWSSAFEQLGKAYVHTAETSAAIDAFQRALALTPQRSALESNLGVAYEQAGDMRRALDHTTRAVELDAERATPWVNLARLLLRVRGAEAARAALAQAAERHVSDPRLRALARELGEERVDQGTTRR